MYERNRFYLPKRKRSPYVVPDCYGRGGWIRQTQRIISQSHMKGLALSNLRTE